MHNKTFVKILACLCILIGIVCFVIHVLPSDKEDNTFYFDVKYFNNAPLNKADSNQSDEEQTDLNSTEEPEEVETPEDEKDIFIIDVWKDKIKDYISKVNEAAEEAKLESEAEDETSVDDGYTDNSNSSAQNNNTSSERSKKLIIDTDFASDADDVIAVRLAMCFQDLGMIDVEGIALSTTYSRSPLAIHALCYQDGYGYIPVAMDTAGNGVQVHTDYVDAIYDMPKSRSDYEQPVDMYRRLLAESDTKVNIITLGFLQNIQGLMNSSPDQYSNLTGAELIAQKVDTLYIVGGNSTGRPSYNFYWTGEKVINAAKSVAQNFPGKVVFLQTDLSDDTFCGQFYSTQDSNQSDAVTKVLKANDQLSGVVAWDVFSMWCAVQDINGNLEQSFLEMQQGTQYISDTGANTWTETSEGRHYRIVKKNKGDYYSGIMNGMLKEKLG
jgi:hypothetical protein